MWVWIGHADKQEDMLAIGLTKLQLDDAVGGEATLDGEGGTDETAKEVRKSLLSTLRNKFEAEGDVKAEEDREVTPKTEVEAGEVLSVKRKARGAVNDE
jgi:SWI/SNF-related matrix-associated actin-dependent regulator 1 of chromatin subfamily A